MAASPKSNVQTEAGGEASLADAMGPGTGTVAKQQGLLKRDYSKEEDDEAKERVGNLFKAFMKHPGAKEEPK